MSNEAKVGIFTVIATTLLIAIVLYLSGFHLNRDSGYKFQIQFNQVTGLKIGANVNYVGINIGKVEKINIDHNKAIVTVKVAKDTQIDRKSLFTISTEGLMGEKFVSILPPEAHSGENIAPDELVMGVDEHGLDYMMQMASTTIIQLQELIHSMNTVLGNKDVQQSMIQTALNLRDLTKNMNQLMSIMAQMAVNNSGNINSMVSNLSQMSSSMATAADELERLIHNFSGNGQSGTYLREAVENLAQTSASVRKMAQNIEPVLADPQTAQQIKNILSSANNISQRADKMMGSLSQMKVSTGVEGMMTTDTHKLSLNADTTIATNDKSFVKLGINALGGDSTTTDVQIGSRAGEFTTRAGIIESKLGGGMDYHKGKAKFSLDAYNPKEPKLRLRSQYQVAEDTYLVGQMRDATHASNRESYIGVRKEF